MSKKWGCLGLNRYKIKWIMGTHGNWKNLNPGGQMAVLFSLKLQNGPSFSSFWRYLVMSKPKGQLGQIFVAFLEYLNFSHIDRKNYLNPWWETGYESQGPMLHARSRIWTVKEWNVDHNLYGHFMGWWLCVLYDCRVHCHFYSKRVWFETQTMDACTVLNMTLKVTSKFWS